VSFVVIARFWGTHRLAFRLIARDDGVPVWLNLLLLLFVAFLPFPTDAAQFSGIRGLAPPRRGMMRPGSPALRYGSGYAVRQSNGGAACPSVKPWPKRASGLV
jgi:Endosomal/lysosomal potassium channel TMEM175